MNILTDICVNCNENITIDGFECFTCITTKYELDSELTLDWKE